MNREKFNTFQELWDNLSYCPVCKDKNRNITIQTIPNEIYEVHSFSKSDNSLDLTCKFYLSPGITNCVFYVDCFKNNFQFSVGQPFPSIAEFPRECEFYLMSNCRKCESSHSTSSDVQFNLLHKTIHDLKIEIDLLYFVNGENRYEVTLNQFNNELTLVKVRNPNEIFKSHERLTFPLNKFDFSDLEKVFNRLRTILVFS